MLAALKNAAGLRSEPVGPLFLFPAHQTDFIDPGTGQRWLTAHAALLAVPVQSAGAAVLLLVLPVPIWDNWVAARVPRAAFLANAESSRQIES